MNTKTLFSFGDIHRRNILLNISIEHSRLEQEQGPFRKISPIRVFSCRSHSIHRRFNLHQFISHCHINSVGCQLLIVIFFIRNSSILKPRNSFWIINKCLYKIRNEIAYKLCIKGGGGSPYLDFPRYGHISENVFFLYPSFVDIMIFNNLILRFLIIYSNMFSCVKIFLYFQSTSI